MGTSSRRFGLLMHSKLEELDFIGSYLSIRDCSVQLAFFAGDARCESNLLP